MVWIPDVIFKKGADKVCRSVGQGMREEEGGKAFGLRHWASRGARYTAWEAEGGQATGDRGPICAEFRREH